MRVVHKKLVRDRIPEIIEAEGCRAVTRILDDASYRGALLAKLVEEAEEAGAAPAHDLPAELADVLEVVRALAGTIGMTWDQLLTLAARKRGQRGGFGKRLFLEYVDEADSEKTR